MLSKYSLSSYSVLVVFAQFVRLKFDLVFFFVCLSVCFSLNNPFCLFTFSNPQNTFWRSSWSPTTLASSTSKRILHSLRYADFRNSVSSGLLTFVWQCRLITHRTLMFDKKWSSHCYFTFRCVSWCFWMNKSHWDGASSCHCHTTGKREEVVPAWTWGAAHCDWWSRWEGGGEQRIPESHPSRRSGTDSELCQWTERRVRNGSMLNTHIHWMPDVVMKHLHLYYCFCLPRKSYCCFCCLCCKALSSWWHQRAVLPPEDRGRTF